ncbi:MAG: hypothetical protein HGN29_07385 [Asgard group archaeon]|nr:hypothetical protein [Asgard group archaeon]
MEKAKEWIAACSYHTCIEESKFTNLYAIIGLFMVGEAILKKKRRRNRKGISA